MSLFCERLAALFWDAPYRSFFWNQELLKPILEGVFNTPWFDYVTSARVDSSIDLIIKATGVFYFFLGFLSLFIKKQSKFAKLLLVGGFNLLILAFLTFMAKSYKVGMLIEHALQVGSPFIFFLLLKRRLLSARSLFMIKLCISLTFLGHGLFAVGYYPVPGNFVDMVIAILGINEDQALMFLKCMGVIDIIVSVMVFNSRALKWVLYFASFWGIATAFARVIANFTASDILLNTHQWLLETIVRIPHGLIPLSLLIFMTHKKNIHD